MKLYKVTFIKYLHLHHLRIYTRGDKKDIAMKVHSGRISSQAACSLTLAAQALERKLIILVRF